MKLNFTKMQGAGNDYIYVDCFQQPLPQDPAAVSSVLSQKCYGIGSDGLILVRPSDCADFMMDIYNADGSRAKMCGNGIRCAAKFAFEHGIIHQRLCNVETLSGIKQVQLKQNDGTITGAAVDMGMPQVRKNGYMTAVEKICSSDLNSLQESITLAQQNFQMIEISMGNPHAVIFVNDLKQLDFQQYGHDVEQDQRFIDGVNLELVQVKDRSHIAVRVWERGSQETNACGTGACAAALAAMLDDQCDQQVAVTMNGGVLIVERRMTDGHLLLSGEARNVFTGTVDTDDCAQHHNLVS